MGPFCNERPPGWRPILQRCLGGTQHATPNRLRYLNTVVVIIDALSDTSRRRRHRRNTHRGCGGRPISSARCCARRSRSTKLSDWPRTHYNPAILSSSWKSRRLNISRIFAIRQNSFHAVDVLSLLEVTITSAEIPLRSYVLDGAGSKKARRQARGVLAAVNHPGRSLRDAQVSAAIRTATPWGCSCPRASGV